MIDSEHVPAPWWDRSSLQKLSLVESEGEGGSVLSNSLPLYSPWDSLGQNAGVGSLSRLQGIFPTQGWDPGLPPCRQILYQPNYP